MKDVYKRQGVRLESGIAVFKLDLVLVNGSLRKSGDEQLEHAGISQPSHLGASAVPHIEIPDHGHAHGARRPDGEVHAPNPVDLHGVRAHFFIYIVVDARLKLLELRLADLRGERVWICLLYTSRCV